MCVRADDTTRLLILRLLDGHGTLIIVTKTLEVCQEGVGQNSGVAFQSLYVAYRNVSFYGSCTIAQLVSNNAPDTKDLIK